jgi:hypothetical protein
LGYLCCIWSIILKLSAIYIPSTGHEFNSHHFLGSFSASHASQDFTAGYHEQFYESMNSTGSEHPLSSLAPITGTPGGFSEISSSDNPFGLTLTGHVPNPLFATEIFSEEMQPQFRPSLHLPTIVDMSNLGPFGELAPPGIGSVAGTNPRPWDDQSQEQRVINGVTFIGGNLNYTHATVTAGKCHGRGFMAFDRRGTDTCHGVGTALHMRSKIGPGHRG